MPRSSVRGGRPMHSPEELKELVEEAEALLPALAPA